MARKKLGRKKAPTPKRGVAWPRWTGFRGKTVWDWLPVVGAFLIPVMIAAGTWQITWQQARIEDQRAEAERELAEQRAQDATLQAYLDQMSDLLLERNLRESEEDSEVRSLARARTLTVLGTLDPSRKTVVMKFLLEAELVQRVAERGPIIGLSNTNLSEVELSEADLSGADLRDALLAGAALSEANLSNADLFSADLSNVDLIDANLGDANLSWAALNNTDLTFTDLSNADLSGADLSNADLFSADLSGADLSYAKRSVGQGASVNITQMRPTKLINADLTGVDLSGANLQRAFLRGADLRGARGLTKEQIESTIGSSETKLPEDLNRPPLWSKSIEEQTKIVQERPRGH